MSATLVETSILKNHKEQITSLEIVEINNTELLCSSSRDKRILCWELKSQNKIVKEFAKSNASVNSLSVAKNANRIISGGNDKFLRIFDFNTQESVVVKGHTGVVKCVSVNCFEDKIVSGSIDKSICVWNTRGELIKSFSNVSEGAHSDWVTCIAFKPLDENQFVSGSLDGTLKVWDIDAKTVKSTFFDGKVITEKQNHDGSYGVKTLDITADGSLCAYGGNNGKVYIINLIDNELVTSFETNNVVNALSFSLTELVLACGTKNKIFFWEVTSGDLLAVIDISTYGTGVSCLALAWHKNILFAGLNNGNIISYEFTKK